MHASSLPTLHLLYNQGIFIACAVCTERWKTRRITYKLLVSCFLMNVNKAVSKEEMRKRERGQERRNKVAAVVVVVVVGGHNYKSLISSENHKVSSQKGS